MEKLREELLKFLSDYGFELTGEQLDEIAVRVSKKPTLKKRKTRPFVRGAGASRFKLPASKYLSRYGVGRAKIKEEKEDPKSEEKLTKGKTWYKYTKANKQAAEIRRVDEAQLSELSNEKLHAYRQAAYDDVNKEMDRSAEKHGAKNMLQHVDMKRIDKRMKGKDTAHHKLASRNKPKDGFIGFRDNGAWRKIARVEETEITELTDKTMLKAADRHLGGSLNHPRISSKRFEHTGKALKILAHSLGRKKRILNTPNHPEGKAVRRFSEAVLDEMKYPTEKKAKKVERGAFVAKMKDKYTNRKDRKAMRMGGETPHTSTPGTSVLYDLKGNGSL